LRDLHRLTASDERRRIDAIAMLHDPVDDARSGCFDERFEFDELGFERMVCAVNVDRDQQPARRPSVAA
jgi:hypothetical protein